MPKTQDKTFENALRHKVGHALNGQPPVVAVACSGGPDSMGLTHILHEWAKSNSAKVHALIVNHNLRPEAADEAATVAERLKNYEHLTPFILNWDNGAKTTSALQENARNARYEIMARHCTAQNISHLFTAHHLNDQAETLLFRLAKGSGLDGLGGIQEKRAYNKTLTLLRPLLGVPKADLLAYCAAHNISYVSDPSNEKDMFARVRLRKSYEALSAEGLTPERLSTTANRLRRAGEALDIWAQDSFETYLIEQTDKHISLNSALLEDLPEEIVIRILLMCINTLSESDKPYPPRLSRVETIAHNMLHSTPFKARTLAGLKFSLRKKRLVIEQLPNRSN